MNEVEKQKYESPCTKRTQVEMEDGICATSRTGTSVVDESNNKVTISQQEHGEWSGTGDDITVGWE